MRHQQQQQVASSAPHIDPVKEAQELEHLQQEYTSLTSRIEEIKNQVREKFALLRQVAPDAVMVSGAVTGKRKPVVNPRPIEDKIIISAGRSVMKSMQQKKTLQDAETEAIKAAQKVAKRYGMSELPENLITVIRHRVASKYQH